MSIQRSRKQNLAHYCCWDDVVLGWSWLGNFLVLDLYVLCSIIIIIIIIINYAVRTVTH
jgi:hypothetical protein